MLLIRILSCFYKLHIVIEEKPSSSRQKIFEAPDCSKPFFLHFSKLTAVNEYQPLKSLNTIFYSLISYYYTIRLRRCIDHSRKKFKEKEENNSARRSIFLQNLTSFPCPYYLSLAIILPMGYLQDEE